MHDRPFLRDKPNQISLDVQGKYVRRTERIPSAHEVSVARLGSDSNIEQDRGLAFSMSP